MDEYDELIPNPFENEDNVRWDSRDLPDKVETLRDSVLDMVQAMTGLLGMVIEGKAHTREHCDTFAVQAEAILNAEDRLKFLEQMLAAPEAHDPQCECDQ